MTRTNRPAALRPSRELARTISYVPDLDGDADPGEIVWTWVAYEEDPTQGKDRPVLVVGRDARAETTDDVLGLMLSSNDRRAADDDWFGVGSGGWDSSNRPSWVRLDRVLVVDADGIRREGAVLDRARFDAVAEQLRERFGWR
ncbi:MULTISPECIES: type II toxin-antitoxin system PemK/MazF family toxin [Gordonia]|uniref:Type II toxin-antitoxin system PemK/MazF family toxin n=1 Tax=Gordonia amicalis TaxID=89053 RepID=A0AAE4U6G3_9ACTN|nr:MULTISPECIES: type II toxin-antitoxin system PemK/MazF family toxin [Gordonia]ATD71538.1 growth inhibitor PemK [Gordonia sp. 1D]MCZ4579202.1 type II toxin-antitoxin system PemK/MazF family toxin [Gordonia amicalis]MDJ0452369.1 type II toxin-antitoxin system PemK/MazF family toxin [Gordonia amicalis]MDV6306380.1 type II toxin-antitoxin system PemK/MazF family toxin [Gordonia amicalis]MDV6313545.1 type II toxin-antitoxin system PemK/MazF family toxin [Gordonia amicalis]